MKYLKSMLFAVLSVSVLFSCATGARRLDVGTDLVSDSGGLTRYELEKSGKEFAGKISQYFEKNPREEGIFLAFYPTKNDTSEMIPTDFFDNQFVKELLAKRIYTVRTTARGRALEEIKLSQSGLTSNMLSLGNMTSPNFFVRTVIKENSYTSSGDRIVEQTVDVELVEVETQLVIWSDRSVYRKQAAGYRDSTGW